MKQKASFGRGEGRFLEENSATLRISSMPTGSQSHWEIWGLGSIHKSAEETSGCGMTPRHQPWTLAPLGREETVPRGRDH